MTTTLKMLWVEDDYSVLSAALLQLTKRGWEIVPCTNYRDALKQIDADVKYDCFLVDLILPQIGCDVEEDRVSDSDQRYLGLKLIERIRDKHGYSSPIAAFSVVHDPAVDKILDHLRVGTRFSKGGNTSNRELCESIEALVARKMESETPLPTNSHDDFCNLARTPGS